MSSKKLLLVSTNQHDKPYPVYPLGLAYLKAYLCRQMPDLDIYSFDFLLDGYDDYIRILEETRPDFIGLSIRNIDDVNIYRMECFIGHYKQIVSHTRQHSNALIIIGGSGYSIYPKILFEELRPDFGICGEGETSLNELLNALIHNLEYSDIEGLLYRKDDSVITNKRNSCCGSPVLDLNDSLIDYYWQKSGMLNVQTKRGCPYNCIYCTYPLIEGHKVRTLDPGQIVHTLSYLYHCKKIDYIFFTDSIFNISNEFNYILAEKLLAAKLKIRWGGYFNFANIDKKLLEVLKQAGLRHIEFGTDSLTDSILEKYGKPFRVSDILRVSEYCSELEIDFAHFMILGGYSETEATLNETFENSKKIGRSVFFPFIGMRIYPGTILHDIAIEENIVKPNDPLLEPVYYVSKAMNLNSIKAMALRTGKQWIFPDDETSDIMIRLRNKNKKGPLWEYLIK